jgi:hypothetical protein
MSKIKTVRSKIFVANFLSAFVRTRLKNLKKMTRRAKESGQICISYEQSELGNFGFA